MTGVRAIVAEIRTRARLAWVGLTGPRQRALVGVGVVAGVLLWRPGRGRPAPPAFVPALILTSDPDDLHRLLDGQPNAGRIVMIAV